MICVNRFYALTSCGKWVTFRDIVRLSVADACFCVSGWQYVICVLWFQMIDVISCSLFCRKGCVIDSIKNSCMLIFQHWPISFLFLFNLYKFICVIGVLIWSHCHALGSWSFSLLNSKFLIRISHLPCRRLPKCLFSMHDPLNFIKSLWR